ncbi:MAG: hypothetical protein JWR02_2230 [Mucilaginibacter sp.]|nr:hypothetical protein [Mucilaginibacter sp.]
MSEKSGNQTNQQSEISGSDKLILNLYKIEFVPLTKR